MWGPMTAYFLKMLLNNMVLNDLQGSSYIAYVHMFISDIADSA